jgi:hypothetical protein
MLVARLAYPGPPGPIKGVVASPYSPQSIPTPSSSHTCFQLDTDELHHSPLPPANLWHITYRFPPWWGPLHSPLPLGPIIASFGAPEGPRGTTLVSPCHPHGRWSMVDQWVTTVALVHETMDPAHRFYNAEINLKPVPAASNPYIFWTVAPIWTILVPTCS